MGSTNSVLVHFDFPAPLISLLTPRVLGRSFERSPADLSSGETSDLARKDSYWSQRTAEQSAAVWSTVVSYSSNHIRFTVVLPRVVEGIGQCRHPAADRRHESSTAPSGADLKLTMQAGIATAVALAHSASSSEWRLLRCHPRLHIPTLPLTELLALSHTTVHWHPDHGTPARFQ